MAQIYKYYLDLGRPKAEALQIAREYGKRHNMEGWEIFGEAAPYASMKDVLEAMMPYIERELARGTRLHAISRHFVGAYHAVPGARAFRRHLAEYGVRPGAGLDVLRDAIALVEQRGPTSLAA